MTSKAKIGMLLSLTVLVSIFLVLNTAVSKDKNSADTYWYKAKELSKQGKYLEAAQMFEKTAVAELASPKSVLSGVSLAYNGAGYHYQRIGRYNKALENFEKALVIDKKLNNHSGIAAQLINIGGIYKDRGQNALAIEYYQEALEISRQVGKEDLIAKNLNNMGTVYKQWGNFDKALEHYQQALEIDKKLANEREMAIRLNNIGHVHFSMGGYDTAIKYYEQAVTINERLGIDDQIAVNLNNMAGVYDARGQYDQAISYYKQAMEINKRLGMEPDVAMILNNTGLVYRSWGKYDQAVMNYREALEICNKIGNQFGKAVILNNIADVSVFQGFHDKAIEYYQQALEINRKIGNEPELAANIANIGEIYHQQGKISRAVEFFQEALEINIKLNAKRNISYNYSDLGSSYHSWGRYDQALEYYRQAHEILQEIGDEPGVATVINNIGHVYYSMGQFDKSIPFFRQSIEIKEKIRRTAIGDIRRDYLASQIYTYQLLASSLLKTNDPEGVFEVIEQSRARLLAERIAGIESQLELPRLKEVQENLAPDEAVLLFSNIDRDNFILMAITGDKVSMKEIPKDNFLAKSQKQYKKPVLMLLEKQRGQLIEQEPQQDTPDSDEKHQRVNLETAVQYYRIILTSPEMKEQATVLGRLFHELLFDPVESIIAGKDHITIMPDGILSFLPFETLVDKGNNYLVQLYNMRYAQSLTINKLLQDRNYTKIQNRKPMLALGGAVYDQANDAKTAVIDNSQLGWLRKETDRNLEAKRSARSSYRKLGVANWPNLPGTLMEVSKLSTIIDDSDTLVGDEVNENRIKQYSSDGRLAKYKVIHFATHGLVVPQLPELSALVLSQFDEELEGEDGYLRMGEIAELNIGADFVNLSACETGLGKIYGGEGVVGLTQSFLIAGANGLSVSLWQVNDESTALFMTELYKKVQDSGMGYNQALTAVKRDFIDGSHGAQWQSPYYWSPFVYYGR